MITRFDFCENFIHLRGKRLSFDGRPYLEHIYNSTAKRMVLRCSRQVEKTSFLIFSTLHALMTIPHVRILVVTPRNKQARVWVRSRFLPVLKDSPVIARTLLGIKRNRQLQVFNLQFSNGAEMFVREAFLHADASRGVDADILVCDEYQDLAPNMLPVLEETLSHSPIKRVLLVGTPKSVDNHIEQAFSRSTANEWRVPCPCGNLVLLDEKVISSNSLICPECQNDIHPATGHWVARNPDSTWADGYWLNHLCVPWVNHPELLEKQQSYNPAAYRNEVLGLPTVLGDHIVTRQQVEACCQDRPMAQRFEDIHPNARGRLMAGIDWSGGVNSNTILTIGYMTDDDRLVVCHMERFGPGEDTQQLIEKIARRCEHFRIRAIAADGRGNGSVHNNLLLHRLPNLIGFYAMIYTVSDSQPAQWKGRLWTWSIGRTPSIGMVFSRIHKQRLLLPRLEDSSSFIDEICCEVAEYDDQKRTIKYTHPATMPDDTLHSLNYLAVIARRSIDRTYVNY